MAESSGGGGSRARVRRTQVTASIDEERGVFMISVAAELAEMHPQTLRMYEARGLITPKRSPKNTRLYSQRDVERLRRIQQMTSEEGLNLAGVETVLEMEERVEKMQAELARMRKRTEELQREMAAEVDRVRRSLKAEIVPYKAYDVIPAEGDGPVKIPVERPRRAGPSAAECRCR
jgi:MerR family transcriptional regulator/heat shock protein HspR